MPTEFAPEAKKAWPLILLEKGALWRDRWRTIWRARSGASPPYFCASVGAVDEETIKKYIESQRWGEEDQGFKITAPTEP